MTARDQAAFELCIDKQTVTQWYKKFRETSCWLVEQRLSGQIGTQGDIIELDECQIGRRKHHTGRKRKDCWVFGGLIRGSAPPSFFIEIVRNRKRVTLLEVLQRRANAAALIVTDGWRSYQDLALHGFNHSWVNHCENFVSPVDPEVHTQGIENLWGGLRKFLNRKGSYTRLHLAAYLKEFTFRKHYVDAFETLVSAIEAKYTW
jgi:transposase-like protein